MAARELGFTSSWKMLTRDDGWIKPVLVLTLVGWIPIIGTIALYGYALEWARLTAWGVDAAPKQKGVNYGKLLTTGGIAFLVSLSMTMLIAVVGSLLFGTSAAAWGVLAPLGTGLSSLATVFEVSSIGVISLLGVAFNIFATVFVLMAAMRSTIYDSFSAGWRIDRLFQMVGRDASGFMRLVGIVLISSLINMAYSLLVGLVGAIFLAGGLATAFVGYGAPPMEPASALLESLIRMGPALLLLLVVLIVALAFVGSAINTAMQLVVINATGQWFSRFDLSRWGLSSDPLPDDVPRSTSHPSSAHSPVIPDQPPMAHEDAPFERGDDKGATSADPFPSIGAPGGDEAPSVRRDGRNPIVPLDGAMAGDDGPTPICSPDEPDRTPIPLPPISDLVGTAQEGSDGEAPKGGASVNEEDAGRREGPEAGERQ